MGAGKGTKNSAPEMKEIVLFVWKSEFGSQEGLEIGTWEPNV
jgi:hypothetical protein